VDLPAGFKIGAVSRRTGISPATLRVWEDEYGLLTPERSPGRQRLYTENDIDRIVYVRELISNRGYSLQGVAALLDEARYNMPPPVQELLLESTADPAARPLLEMAAELRAYLEDAYLRVATNRDQIREGQLLAEVHALARRIAQSASFYAAASMLVAECTELIGNQPTTLARYNDADDVLRGVVSARGGEIVPADPKPVAARSLAPAPFQLAFRERVPYYARQISVDEAPPYPAHLVSMTNIQSFYACPLGVGTETVGLLVVTSRRADGVSPEDRGICTRLSAVSGPALAYLSFREAAGPVARTGAG
jgi:DNA-binding transcriptional MerR regulator